MKKLLFVLLMLPSLSYGRDLCVPIPDGIEARVIEALAYKHGYRDFIKNQNNEDIPNPQTKAQYIRGYFKNYFQEITRIYEAEVAAKVEFERVKNLGESEIILP